MAEKLDGSFSGLWTCELCGKTGTDCTCEHFDRGSVWGHHGTELSDAELMAEYWSQQLAVVRAVDRAYPYGDSPQIDIESERTETIERIGGIEW